MKILEARRVTRFALRRSLIHKLEKRDKSETKEILSELRGGAVCSLEGPFLLEADSSPYPEYAWKEIFERFLTRRFTPKYGRRAARLRALAYMERLYEEVPKKEVVKILVKANPKWREKADVA